MKKFLRITPFVSVIAASALVSCQSDHIITARVPETNKEPTSAQIVGNVFEPALVPATDERIAQLKVPAGFTIAKYADGLGKPRMLVVNESGGIYVSSREAGTVTLLRDTNNDGVADARQIVATIKGVHGMAIYAGKFYMVSIKEVYSATLNSDGTLG